MTKRHWHLVVIIGIVLSVALLAKTAKAETSQSEAVAKLLDFELARDNSIDIVYLAKSNKLVAGVGITPITLFDKTIGIRVNYINDLRGSLTDDDMVGLFLQTDIKKVAGLIPKAQWQIPDLGLKLGIGYIVNVETMNFRKGEAAISVSIIRLF